MSVSGNVDSTTLVKKLVKCGKHAELWSHKINQNQKELGQKVKNLETLKKKKPNFLTVEEDDDEIEAEDEQMNLFRSQIALLNQQAADNAKKGMMMNNNGGNGNSISGNHQNQIGVDPRTLAAMKMNSHVNGNDINSMMNLAGFHGSGVVGANIPAVAPVNMQMMYSRSPALVPPTTGYYCNYDPVAVNEYGGGNNSATHMFSDDNTTSSCSIM